MDIYKLGYIQGFEAALKYRNQVLLGSDEYVIDFLDKTFKIDSLNHYNLYWK